MTPPTTPSPLDFAAIRSSCPAAFKQLQLADVVHAGRNASKFYRDSLGCLRLHYPRDLFDFFDQQGVYVSVDRFIKTGAWYWEISGKAGLSWQNPEETTRTSAESAAFMAAFEKLEDRLKQEDG